MNDDVDLEPGDPAMRFPLQDYLDFEISRGAGRGRCGIERVDDRHGQPHGAVHGGVVFTILDTAMGAAATSVLEEGQICATSDLQIRFLRPAFEGSLTADATVVNAGRRLVTVRGDVTDGEGRLIATGTAAFAVLEG
ncbi:MAG: PaaI family thioesterase [Actinomycetota bacterium]